jgi:2-keto-3-deoxy-L-rhamnonate aldolase RhmA
MYEYVNGFKADIAARKKKVGIWFSSCSPVVADLVSDCGFDWALIDMEHSVNELLDVVFQKRMLEKAGTVPIVRPSWNDKVKIKRLLDVGVTNLLIPWVETAAEAEAAAKATRYATKGVRGVSLGTSANRFTRRPGYFAECEKEICLLLQVESPKAIANIDSIAAVEGVDGIFIGPADLSANMGVPGKTDHPQVQEMIHRGLEKIKKANKPAGTLIFDHVLAKEYFTAGFTYVAVGSDLSFLRKEADTTAQLYKQYLAGK